MPALYIGLMSGTSMDGIDAALVDFSSPRQPRLLAMHSECYSADLLEELHQLNYPVTDELHRAEWASRKVARAFANTTNNLLKANQLRADDIKAIGSHGQTIRHLPDGEQGFSVQIGDPFSIAVQTGVDVIADFRNKDIALGGQGAPLVPAFHHAVFASAGRTRAIVNIGGISNVTLLPGEELANISGYDTGPGNTLMDGWCRRHLQQPYDRDGQWAAQGVVNEPLLTQLLSHHYFYQPPPKSTGRDLFSMNWLDEQLAQLDGISPADVQTTLLHFTAKSIANSLADLTIQELYVCGGGAHNPSLMNVISQYLPNTKVYTTAQLGIAPDAVEAMAFAWLAFAFDQQYYGNVPAVTGAERSAVLGARYPAR